MGCAVVCCLLHNVCWPFGMNCVCLLCVVNCLLLLLLFTVVRCEVFVAIAG